MIKGQNLKRSTGISKFYKKNYVQGGPVPVDLRLRVLQIAEINDNSQTMTVEMSVGLTWTEPRLLFNNIFDWESRKLIKVEAKI